jgi:hypothetical protein
MITATLNMIEPIPATSMPSIRLELNAMRAIA